MNASLEGIYSKDIHSVAVTNVGLKPDAFQINGYPDQRPISKKQYEFVFYQRVILPFIFYLIRQNKTVRIGCYSFSVAPATTRQGLFNQNQLL